MIYLVRHGEAAAGWGTHPDPGLSDLGKHQAQSVAESLIRSGVRQIVSSPMQRCQETAAPLARQLGQAPSICSEVSEIETPAAVEDRVGWLKTLMEGTWDAAGPTYRTWREAAVEAVVSLEPHTAVFTHFVAINAIVSALRKDARVLVFKPGHCSVTPLQRNALGEFCAKTLGTSAETQIL